MVLCRGSMWSTGCGPPGDTTASRAATDARVFLDRRPPLGTYVQNDLALSRKVGTLMARPCQPKQIC